MSESLTKNLQAQSEDAKAKKENLNRRVKYQEGKMPVWLLGELEQNGMLGMLGGYSPDSKGITLLDNMSALEQLYFYKRNRARLNNNGIDVPSIDDIKDANEDYKSQNPDWIKKYIIAHEEKHHINDLKGIQGITTSKEQAYKLNMHDEISANIAMVLEMRNQYLEKGNFDFEYPAYLQFYVDAVKSGEIDPKAKDKESFDKEMSFIMNGTQKIWEDTFSATYDRQGVLMANKKAEKLGEGSMRRNDENYNNAVKAVYTIGGIDFSQYMKNDVTCYNQDIKDWDAKMAETPVGENDKIITLAEAANQGHDEQTWQKPGRGNGLTMSIVKSAKVLNLESSFLADEQNNRISTTPTPNIIDKLRGIDAGGKPPVATTPRDNINQATAIRLAQQQKSRE